MNLLAPVREHLLSEARQSPQLLADLAGLEAFLAESYAARAFFEFLQNADDAGARRFAVRLRGDRLIIANDGRPFSAEDLEALCRSAASHKTRGDSIGFRGIGFKSVVSVANSVYLNSGGYRCLFSRERTAALLPSATRVPLVRIPHDLEAGDDTLDDLATAELEADGFTCVFVLTGLDGTAVREEFDAFEPSTLLFLRHVTEVDLGTGSAGRHKVRREHRDGRALIQSEAAETEWTLLAQGGVTVAIPATMNGMTEAVVHAFLPTMEPTGFGFKINADVSTDPSRTRVVLDDRTTEAIRVAAKIVGRLVRGALEIPDQMLVRTLIPLSDLRLASLKRRSFATELADVLANDPDASLADYRLRPPWLNPKDFVDVSVTAGLKPVPAWIGDIAGAVEFLAHLGAREPTYEELRPGIRDATVTQAGAADVVARMAMPGATVTTDHGERIWVIDGRPQTLVEAVAEGRTLDGSFVDQVVERLGSRSAVRRLVVTMAGTDAADVLLGRDARPEQQVPTVEPMRPKVQPGSLRRWRSAEQQVLSALSQQGWELEDVSRQNLGYDLSGTQPGGEPTFVEVKSVTSPGQPIVITSNEEAVARLQGSAYVIAIACEVDAGLQLALIPDPVSSLSLARQCRQWVWECQSYPFEPTLIPFSSEGA